MSESKITLSDLKITTPCWQWMAGKTEDYKFASNQYGNFIDGQSIDNIDSKNLSKGMRQFLQSFIYQAIDEINNQYWSFYQHVTLIRLVFPNIDIKEFLFNDYDSKTTARLAALQWIWQQEQGQE